MDEEHVSDDSNNDLLLEVAAAAEKIPAGETKPRRRRSNRPYPPASLEEAVKFAREIYEFNSGLPVRKLSFFDHVGRSPESSASREAITNGNKYGLLKGSFSSEQLELTPDALAIVADSCRPREQAKAKVRLGIDNIDPFKRLYEKLAGSRLPVTNALADSMLEVDVPADLAQEAVDLFVVNLRFVGLLQVLSGAERVVTIDHLLDNLPSVEEAARQPKALLSPHTPATQHESESSSPVTQERADFETTCFYITPIGNTDSDARKHSDLFLGSLIEPAMSPLGLKVVRADAIDKPGVITRQIMEFILRSRLVIADLSFHNPNVFYELALRHAVRLPIVQIVRKSDNVPFDINQMRTIQIDNTDLYSFVPKIEVYKSEIAAQARRALESGSEADTPISIYFPNLKASLN